MNWYRFAQFDIQDLRDRSTVNNTIHFLEGTVAYLDRLGKIVFQNARLARAINSQIMNHKKVSSYPVIRDILIAADKIALDSPWRFAAMCKVAAEEVAVQVAKLKQEVKQFTEEELPKRMKGFVDGK
jgi:hypothetical protein